MSLLPIKDHFYLFPKLYLLLFFLSGERDEAMGKAHNTEGHEG